MDNFIETGKKGLQNHKSRAIMLRVSKPRAPVQHWDVAKR